MTNQTKKSFCSWSGGKDSALALYKAIQSGIKPSYLLTMMIETGDRSRSHGIHKSVLEAQAKALGIPIRFCSASWDSYTDRFLNELKTLNELGVQTGIFGDIDIEAHYQWVHSVCEKNHIQPLLPLWQNQREVILKELTENDFQAEIIAVKEGILPPTFLGKALNIAIFKDFKTYGIDLCGEAGEYHTFVTNGPLFKYPLQIKHGEQVLKSGYWFSDISLV
ncbi:MAG: diphthine--ammonia ligase [Parachlamydiaceae bacterium]|nr:diphthine--ammonia ligase [Parachlamydiaceae bacterium]